MIIHDVIQGSPTWASLRAGIPTASNFDKILSPGGADHKKPVPSKSAESYMFTLLAERMCGRPLRELQSAWMDRGSYLEHEAVDFYEFEKDCDTRAVGFMTTDDGKIGASPDRLVGDVGLLEVKCPAPSTHVGYLLSASIEGTYFVQLQGQLWIAERDWVDIVAYHPEMPPAIVRVERDEIYIEQLRGAVRTFSVWLEDMAADFERRGWMKPIRFMESMAGD